jgi:hypothetical protein
MKSLVCYSLSSNRTLFLSGPPVSILRQFKPLCSMSLSGDQNFHHARTFSSPSIVTRNQITSTEFKSHPLVFWKSLASQSDSHSWFDTTNSRAKNFVPFAIAPIIFYLFYKSFKEDVVHAEWSTFRKGNSFLNFYFFKTKILFFSLSSDSVEQANSLVREGKPREALKLLSEYFKYISNNEEAIMSYVSISLSLSKVHHPKNLFLISERSFLVGSKYLKRRKDSIITRSC